jgi:hypothetical protein
LIFVGIITTFRQQGKVASLPGDRLMPYKPMTELFICTPSTAAEKQNFAQCNGLSWSVVSSTGYGYFPPSMACETSVLDVFPSTFSGEFELDVPVAIALVERLAVSQPNEAALILAASLPAFKLPTSENLADATLDTLVGKGNILGNLSASVEAALRIGWKSQAKTGFKALVSGAQSSVIRLGPHVSIEPHKIGKGGVLRKGARLNVRIHNLPISVMHSLPSPMIPKSGGQFGAMRVGARDLKLMDRAGVSIADARIKAGRLLRFTSTKVGGGVLAFGPSAAFDFYDSASWQDNSLAVDWGDFAVRSAKSQSGNLAGFVTGLGVGAAALAIAPVALAGAPVVLVILGAGLIAQIAWNSTGGDEWAAGRARNALGR